MQLVLNGILFCFILLLCAFSFMGGYHLGNKKKNATKPKIENNPLTAEQEFKIKKRQMEEENFWNYNGDVQGTS